MRIIRWSLLLVVAMPWPAFAQEPPAGNESAKPRAALSAPESSATPAVANPKAAFDRTTEPIEPKAEPIMPKFVPMTGPIASAAPEVEIASMVQPAPPLPSEVTFPIVGLAPLGEPRLPGHTLFGAGAWFTSNTGSIIKTGEYQGMTSSPFWVFDGLYSNGNRTLGIYGNQTDNDSYQAGVHFFQQKFYTDFDYQLFIHRLEHVSLNNFTESNRITDKTNFPANSVALGKDASIGQEYAIRVEELRSSTGWRINDNLRARIDFWQMRKFGERQENAAAHCFVAAAGGSKNCHVVSQSQHIDWTTTEVTPRLEAKIGPLIVEYSRPMRQFIDNDQTVFRNYNNGSLTKPSSSGGMIWGDYPYAIVPQTVTQIDQLKGALDLGPTRQVFAFGYIGSTHNQDRDVYRYFNGGDLRLTDWTLPRTSLTLYGKMYNQTGTRPTTLNESELQFLTFDKANAEIRTPIEFHRSTAGVKGSWRPDLGGVLFGDVNFTAGYEYDHLGRVNAIWQTPFLSSPGSPAGSQEEGVFEQANTTTQTLFVGARKPWGYHFDTFVRYKVHFVDNVLYGFRELSNVLNTALPQQRHIVEFGAGWYPVSNFSVSFDQSIQLGRSHFDNTAEAAGNVVDFHEQAYATTVTVLYAPTRKLSLMSSVSVYSDWINQNLFLGDDYLDPEDPVPPKNAKMPLATIPAYYAGRSEVFNFYLNYRLTEKTRVTLGYQFVHGSNQLNTSANPSFAFSPSLSTSEPKGALTFADLGQFSATRVDTNKVTAGFSWQIRPRATLGIYYNFFSYLDETNSSNTGTAHQVNASLYCIW